MLAKMENRILFPALGIAFWPVWLWYYRSITSAGGDYTGLIPFIPISLYLVFKKKNGAYSARDWTLTLPLAFTIGYMLGYWWLPPLGRAAIAWTVVCSFLSNTYGRQFDYNLWGLSILTLPVISTLQFITGYPLRVVVAAIAAFFLRMGGLPVIRDGVLLDWCGRLVAVDAPCSGIQMLWAGFLLVFTLLLFWEIPAKRALFYTGLTVPLIIIGNAMRTVALFYSETKIIALPSGTHLGIGMSCFGLIGGIIYVFIQWYEKRILCNKS